MKTTTFIVSFATTTNLIAELINLQLVSIGNQLLIIDGHSPNIGDLILVKDQTTHKHNGIYKVISVGGPSNTFILERYTASLYYEIGTTIYINNGDANQYTFWIFFSDADMFTCNVSSIQYKSIGQHIKSNNSLIGEGNNNSLLGVNISDKTTNQLKQDNGGGLYVEVEHNDTLLGNGSSTDPLKIKLSEDVDNIMTYGSDGGILARVNVTNTNVLISIRFNGFTTTTDALVTYNIRGQIATIQIDALTGVSNNGELKAIAAVPLLWRPSNNLKKVCYVVDNGVEKKGTLIIKTNGDIEIFTDINTVFESSGTKELKFFTCSWLIK